MLLLDKSSSANVSNPISSAVLNNLCTDTGLIDIWRHLNPNVRDYTFYWHPHNSYSRLDYFFIPKQYLQSVQVCHIDSFVLSDHASVHLTIIYYFIIYLFNKLGSPTWKFNSSLLNNGPSCTFIRNSLSEFWHDNKDSPVSPAMIWDADTLSHTPFTKRNL